MKNLVSIILIAFAINSCNHEGTITLSGNLIGGTKDTLILESKVKPLNDGIQKNEHYIPVNEDGGFSYEIKGKAGYYSLKSKSKIMRNPLLIYLKPKQPVILDIQTKDWLYKKEYEVHNSPENKYLKAFDLAKNEFRRNNNPRKTELDEYLKELDSLRLMLVAKLNETVSSISKPSSIFQENESKKIVYLISYFKEDYAAENGNSTLPENYFDFRSELNYNDEELLALDFTYGMTIRKFISNETKRTLPEGEDWIIHQIKTCINNISNQRIIDYVLINEVELNLSYSSRYDEAIELFLSNCSNERYRKMASEKYQIYLNTKPGNPSPKFTDYENYDGGKTSLDDLRGNMLLIDIWATWCGPCKAEIPALKELEEKYRGKGIEFISISVDKEENKNTWRQMVEDEQFKGIQLFADNDMKSQFIRDYSINAIPRFLLIDAEGNIISNNAPRPSNPELDLLLEELLK